MIIPSLLLDLLYHIILLVDLQTPWKYSYLRIIINHEYFNRLYEYLLAYHKRYQLSDVVYDTQIASYNFSIWMYLVIIINQPFLHSNQILYHPNTRVISIIEYLLYDIAMINTKNHPNRLVIYHSCDGSCVTFTH